MPRTEIGKVMEKKLNKWFAMTLDTDNDGLVKWSDFELAVETIVPNEEAAKNARLKILRKRVEQNFQKYFADLCEVGDANGDGQIDIEEWLDVMNKVIKHLKDKKCFPDWYDGLHKSLFRANEFMDDRNVSKDEFVNMMLTWSVDEEKCEAAFDAITENGKKKMDYNLFTEFMHKFLLCDKQGDPINLGLDK
jgi:Ca2+-binding EF-hand superfamily protein